MKINSKRLKKYLQKFGLTFNEFLKLVGLENQNNFDPFAGSGTLDKEATKKFIFLVGAEEAMELIDWEAMNVKRPKRRTIFANAY